MAHQVRSFWVIFTTCLLIFGFQNCGTTSYDAQDLVQDASLETVKDAKYKDGLTFQQYDAKAVLNFKAKKIDYSSYELSEHDSLSECNINDANPIEELLQITNVATVTHPSLINNTLEICPEEIQSYIQLGEEQPIYLIAKNSNLNCLLYDPQMFLLENKRVFIINNLSSNEVENLIAASRDLLSSKNCKFIAKEPISL